MKTIGYTVFASFLLAFPTPTQAAHHEFTIDDVAFLAGHWVGSDDIGAPEEGWSPRKRG